MKRIEMAKDYAEFLIRAKFLVKNIEKSANDRDFDVAKFMAHELKITAMLMGDAIEREIAKQSGK